MVAVFEWVKNVFLMKPVGPVEEPECIHKWSLPKQFVVGERVFIGRRCKLCKKFE